VYIKAGNDVQRSIRTIVFDPVKEIGTKPQLLELIQNFPEGAENLIVRIVYAVTDRGLNPKQEVVQAVKEVVGARKLGAQFLIPILGRLTKQDLITYLPFLIDAQAPLKEVITRLLDQARYTSALSPADLLIQLHLINKETHGIGVKRILEAMDLCLTFRAVYKQEVLAIVLQKLVEHTPLPELLMRTVIQSFRIVPALGKYIVSTIFQTLVRASFWKSKQLWMGFVRACKVSSCAPVFFLRYLP